MIVGQPEDQRLDSAQTTYPRTPSTPWNPDDYTNSEVKGDQVGNE